MVSIMQHHCRQLNPSPSAALLLTNMIAAKCSLLHMLTKAQLLKPLSILHVVEHQCLV